MGLLRLNPLRLDAFHCALLVAIVLLAVYAFGSFREGNDTACSGLTYAHCTNNDDCKWIGITHYDADGCLSKTKWKQDLDYQQSKYEKDKENCEAQATAYAHPQWNSSTGECAGYITGGF